MRWLRKAGRSGDTARRRCIALYVPDHDGHRLEYASHVIEFCQAAGHDFLVGTPRAAQSSPEWQTHMGPLPSGTVFSVSESPRRGIRDICSILIHTARAKSGNPVLVLLDGDRELRRAWHSCVRLRRERGELVGLLMRPVGRGELNLRHVALKTLVVWGYRHILGARLLNLVDPLRSPSFSGRYHVTDPVPRPRGYSPSADAGEDGRKMILLAGRLTERKRVSPTIEWWLRESAHLPSGTTLHVKGLMDAPTRERAAAIQRGQPFPESLVVDDRVLSSTEIYKAVRAASVVLLTQDHGGSSGMLVRALDCGVPVAGVVTETFARAVNGSGVGCLAREFGPALTACVRYCLARPPAIQTGLRSARQRLLSGEQFARRLVEDPCDSARWMR